MDNLHDGKQISSGGSGTRFSDALKAGQLHFAFREICKPPYAKSAKFAKGAKNCKD